MSAADMAAGYVRRMIERETTGWGDTNRALHRIAAKYKLPYHTLNNLRTGRSKTVDATIFQRIRWGYLSMCEHQLSKLAHEIATEKAKGHDTFDDIAREAEILASRVEERKRALMR